MSTSKNLQSFRWERITSWWHIFRVETWNILVLLAWKILFVVGKLRLLRDDVTSIRAHNRIC